MGPSTRGCLCLGGSGNGGDCVRGRCAKAVARSFGHRKIRVAGWQGSRLRAWFTREGSALAGSEHPAPKVCPALAWDVNGQAPSCSRCAQTKVGCAGLVRMVRVSVGRGSRPKPGEHKRQSRLSTKKQGSRRWTDRGGLGCSKDGTESSHTREQAGVGRTQPESDTWTQPHSRA